MGLALQNIGSTPLGYGMNRNIPFGPYRIDAALAHLAKAGDTKIFTFNVGMAF